MMIGTEYCAQTSHHGTSTTVRITFRKDRPYPLQETIIKRKFFFSSGKQKHPHDLLEHIINGGASPPYVTLGSTPTPTIMTRRTAAPEPSDHPVMGSLPSDYDSGTLSGDQVRYPDCSDHLLKVKVFSDRTEVNQISFKRSQSTQPGWIPLQLRDPVFTSPTPEIVNEGDETAATVL